MDELEHKAIYSSYDQDLDVFVDVPTEEIDEVADGWATVYYSVNGHMMQAKLSRSRRDGVTYYGFVRWWSGYQDPSILGYRHSENYTAEELNDLFHFKYRIKYLENGKELK